MGHVFISYKQNPDRHFAAQLVTKIQAGGYEAWQDISGLSVGADWRSDIDQAIRESFALVVVISPDSQKSEYVTYEWAFALGVGVKVIPILLTKVDKMHPHLEALQYLNFTEDRAPWERLMEVLAEADKEYHLHPIRPTRNTPNLVQNALGLLDDVNADKQRRGIEILAQTDDQDAQIYLNKALEHPNQYVRYWAAVFSKTAQLDNILPLLVEALGTSYAELRTAASTRLISIGEPAVAALLPILNDQNHPHRDFAVHVIGEVRDPSGTSLLVSMLPVSDEELTIKCYEAFAKIGDNYAVFTLELALQDARPKVRAAAISALKKIAQREIQVGYSASAVPALGKYFATLD